MPQRAIFGGPCALAAWALTPSCHRAGPAAGAWLARSSPAPRPPWGRRLRFAVLAGRPERRQAAAEGGREPDSG